MLDFGRRQLPFLAAHEGRRQLLLELYSVALRRLRELLHQPGRRMRFKFQVSGFRFRVGRSCELAQPQSCSGAEGCQTVQAGRDG